MKRKIVFLILLLLVTAIPTFLFIIGNVFLLDFIIQREVGTPKVVWKENQMWLQLEIDGKMGDGKLMINVFLPIALGICVPIFFASILLLYKEWQIRKESVKKREGFRELIPE